MISNITELKDFILWCKKQKLQAVSIENMSFQLSSLALMDEEAYEEQMNIELDSYEKQQERQNLEAQEEEENLFHSADS